jgi:hypothetical protein
MKRTLIASTLVLLFAVLGGCVVTPYHYRGYDDGYYRHDYYGDGYYHHYGYGYGYGYQDRDHGG